MNNKEMALLGLLAEGPQYGYQLEESIETRGMREWTEIGFSSIYYLLNKLADQGWILARMEPSTQGPDRKVFSLSTAGLAALKEALTTRLAAPAPHTGDFDLALVFQNLLPPAEVTACLTRHQQRLEESLLRVQNRWGAQAAQGLPAHVHALFDHSLHEIQSELDWVTHYLAQRKETPNGKDRL